MEFCYVPTCLSPWWSKCSGVIHARAELLSASLTVCRLPGEQLDIWVMRCAPHASSGNKGMLPSKSCKHIPARLLNLGDTWRMSLFWTQLILVRPSGNQDMA